MATNHAMEADLGPCPRRPGGVETVGLRLRPGVTLDCQGHVIRGPGDSDRDAFGIKVGAADGATVTNCSVTRFWWGIHVEGSRNVLIESNHLYENGWKVPARTSSWPAPTTGWQ